MVIGDSILKGIKTRGLRQYVKIVTLPGKKARDACIRLRSWDMSECENVVLYIGGNDVAAGKSVTSVEQEFRCTLDALDNGRRRFFICLICPRADINVNPLNTMIQKLCRDTYADQIDLNQTFVREHGRPLFNLFHADGIHPNNAGSNLLVKTISQAIPIIRERISSDSESRRPKYNNGYQNSQPPHTRINSHNHRKDVLSTRDSTTRGYWQHPRRPNMSPRFDDAYMGPFRRRPDGISEASPGSPRRRSHMAPSHIRWGYRTPSREHPVPSGFYDFDDDTFVRRQRHNSYRSGSPTTGRSGTSSRNPHQNRTLYA